MELVRGDAFLGSLCRVGVLASFLLGQRAGGVFHLGPRGYPDPRRGPGLARHLDTRNPRERPPWGRGATQRNAGTHSVCQHQ